MRIAILTFLLAALVPQLHADTILYGSNPSNYPNTTTALNSYFPNGYAESTGGLFQVTGTTTGTTQVTMKYLSQNGDFNFSFGYFMWNGSLPADPSNATSLRSWVSSTMSSAVQLFNEANQSPGATATINAPAGSIIGFYIIPNGTVANFNANINTTNPFTSSLWPLFSVAGANPNNSDQALVFGNSTNKSVMVSFEDNLRLTSGSSSDSDFNDVIISGVNLVPVPEPSTYAAWSVGLILLFMVLRRKQKLCLTESQAA